MKIANKSSNTQYPVNRESQTIMKWLRKKRLKRTVLTGSCCLFEGKDAGKPELSVLPWPGRVNSMSNDAEWKSEEASLEKESLQWKHENLRDDPAVLNTSLSEEQEELGKAKYRGSPAQLQSKLDTTMIQASCRTSWREWREVTWHTSMRPARGDRQLCS